MFLDIHLHAVRFNDPRQVLNTFATPEELLSRYEELQIDRCPPRVPGLHPDQ